jgi:hypothetical protein
MPRVDSWFEDWVCRHIERVPRPDWPMPGSEFWETWRAALGRHKVDAPLADLASRAVAEAPPPYLDRQLGAVLDAARALRASDEAGPGAPAGDWAAAREASRDCADCAGEGQVSVYHRTLPRSCAALCACPAGRWLDADRSRRPELGRPLRLADVRAGRAPYALDPPAPAAAPGGPAGDFPPLRPPRRRPGESP